MNQIYLRVVAFIFPLFISAQGYTEYITGNTTDVTTSHNFGICLMGGATENDNAMRWFLQQANGGDVVVLRTSGTDGYNNYFFQELGITVNSVRTFVINTITGATDPYVIDKVEKAEAIWFAGGDQYTYATRFKDNALEDALNEFINIKLGVIGGTSAGMAILGNHYFDAANGTVTSAVALNNPYHTNVSLGYNDFLEIPMLESVITDTHYDNPDRMGRHAAFMARFAVDQGARSFGIACEEYTAICVNENGEASVFGDHPTYADFAYFIQANCVTNYTPENCVSGQPLTWSNGNEALKVYKVPGNMNGTNTFNIQDWETGSGGSWENWYVNNGSFQSSATTNPMCNLLNTPEIEIPEVNVYPNPFNNYIKITESEFEFDVTLFDVNGKMITINIGEDNLIDTSSLSSGVYILKLDFGDMEKSIKLIKD